MKAIASQRLPTQIQSQYGNSAVVCYQTTHVQFGVVYAIQCDGQCHYWRRSFGVWVRYA